MLTSPSRRKRKKNLRWIQQHPDRHPQRDSSQQPEDDRIPSSQDESFATQRPGKQTQQHQRKHDRNRQPDWTVEDHMFKIAGCGWHVLLRIFESD